MPCYQCGAYNGDSLGLCDACHTSAKVEFDGYAENVVREKRAQTFFMRCVSVICVLLVLGFISAIPVIRPLFAQTLGPASIVAADGSRKLPCAYSDVCVYIYVAPWCPACKGTVGTLNRLHPQIQDNKALGFAPVVGAADEAQLRAFAGKLNSRSFLDLDLSFSRAAKIRAFPTWLAVDMKTKKVLGKFSGNPAGGSAQQILDNLKDRLNVDEGSA